MSTDIENTAELPESASYAALLEDVEGIVQRLSSDQLDLDQIVGQVERGYTLIKAMQQRLAEVKGKVETLQLKFEGTEEN